MWSEHCSYKSSRRHLAKLPTTGLRVIFRDLAKTPGVVGHRRRPGGVSSRWNRTTTPRFIEPYQGAPPGSAAIMRDVFTMGARPIALC